MNSHDRQELFDRWAVDYDRTVASSTDEFPFDGYDAVLAAVLSWAELRPGMTVLDLGIGTGNLARLIVEQQCTVWGTDFSAAMIEQARTKLPGVVLVQADVLEEWPEALPASFDRIVSAYMFHELDLESKVAVIGRLARQRLAAGGLIVIGDIAFPTASAREAASTRWRELWDDEEFYWAADEALIAMDAVGLAVEFQQVSICAGIFRVRAPD